MHCVKRWVLYFIGGFLSVVAAHGQATFLWSGSGGNDFGSGSNWVGGSAPSAGSNLTFGDAPYPNDVNFNDNDLTVGDIAFTGSAMSYFIQGYEGGFMPAPTLTLNGGMSSTDLSASFGAFFNLNLALAPGSHLFEVDGAEIYLFAPLTGSGDLVKAGGGILDLINDSSGYTGGVTIGGGTIYVESDNALGTGLVTLDGGALVNNTENPLTLGNAFLLGSDPVFGNGAFIEGEIHLTGPITAEGSSVTLHALSDHPLFLDGDISGATAFTFTTADSLSQRGTIILGGSNSYTGGTVAEEATVIFANAAAIPASGLLAATGDGYIGSEVTTNLQLGFLDRFDKSHTDGIVGFDSADLNDPQVFTGDIDLTGFDPATRLGTATAAILMGHITPAGDSYQFGGRGTLTVTSDLAGSLSLQAAKGVHVFLEGNNSYDGGTFAFDGGAVVFGTAGSIPDAGSLTANAAGYLGIADPSVAAGDFLLHFDTGGMDGVIGFDSADPASPRTVSDAIDLDLAGFSSGVFLGSSTSVILNGTITPPAGGDYRFTGFRDGKLIVDSTLTGSSGVIIGLNFEDIGSVGPAGTGLHPSVTLDGDNDYTGGTTLQSGQLILGSPTALGTGPLDVEYFGGAPTGLSTNTAGLVIANAISFESAYGFLLNGDYDFTLSGNLSGDYGYLEKFDCNTIALSGDNAALALDFNVHNGTLVFASDTAAGTGAITLINNDDRIGEISFTSAAPAMGNLYGDGGTYVHLSSGTQLTVNQTSDGTYNGTIDGAGGLIKSGAASLALTGTNLYGGGTFINQGTLLASNGDALGSGTVTINGGSLSLGAGVVLANPLAFGGAGGLLGGNGTFGSAITVGSHVVLSPGNSPGTLTFTAGLTLAGGGTLEFQVQDATGSPGAGYDLLSVSGAPLTVSAAPGNVFTLVLQSLDAGGNPGGAMNFNAANTYSWTFATSSGGIAGFAASAFILDASSFAGTLGGTFDVAETGNSLVINFTPAAVPEPSSLLLLAVGLAATLAIGVRRRI